MAGQVAGDFLEDIPLRFVTCFLVLCVFDMVIFCYLGFYQFVVRSTRVYNAMMNYRENILSDRGCPPQRC